MPLTWALLSPAHAGTLQVRGSPSRWDLALSYCGSPALAPAASAQETGLLRASCPRPLCPSGLEKGGRVPGSSPLSPQTSPHSPHPICRFRIDRNPGGCGQTLPRSGSSALGCARGGVVAGPAEGSSSWRMALGGKGGSEGFSLSQVTAREGGDCAGAQADLEPGWWHGSHPWPKMSPEPWLCRAPLPSVPYRPSGALADCPPPSACLASERAAAGAASAWLPRPLLLPQARLRCPRAQWRVPWVPPAGAVLVSLLLLPVPQCGDGAVGCPVDGPRFGFPVVGPGFGSQHHGRGLLLTLPGAHGAHVASCWCGLGCPPGNPLLPHVSVSCPWVSLPRACPGPSVSLGTGSRSVSGH
uniref:uncharacterized protein LOC120886346 n=1 Tax=Ictidomys tridecemlineatus TaxID=43179 RepID=UPI001A9F5D66|nr:uncharacterized protein LOC120886346 [Ictidomys tridecemlineatus]XP_040131013.1 uncharacterized protein LOC120886346 [Ictidomys tridecemlineatus]XP_040131014.1 uncharacterized protein LOC120886346 [Ictidomys tridecemlineatus]XP_040131015.1 uncharacterized protein LOC120886346 [Ictidomys tridecemlineatus]XP_040131016.1 uncharacterized protein LOC120886346 [Ictidomys tridecemlineatus]XP_040131017.1 uncharacterized protein LOC120886346 [Ictidomys tridecemlineatus]